MTSFSMRSCRLCFTIGLPLLFIIQGSYRVTIKKHTVASCYTLAFVRADFRSCDENNDVFWKSLLFQSRSPECLCISWSGLVYETDANFNSLDEIWRNEGKQFFL